MKWTYFICEHPSEPTLTENIKSDQNLKEQVDKELITAKIAMVKAVNKDIFR